jgi:hypothetical protein
VIASLVRWKHTNILLDGYHRVQRLRQQMIPFQVVDIELSGYDAAIEPPQNWWTPR